MGAERRSAEAWVREGEMGLEAIVLTFFFGGMLDKELDDELEAMKTNPALAPPNWHARCRVSKHGHRG